MLKNCYGGPVCCEKLDCVEIRGEGLFVAGKRKRHKKEGKIKEREKMIVRS
jgi:hypothetical protein